MTAGRSCSPIARPASDCYNLYEIQIDGTGLRQVTQGPYDDYEAAYLPDDDIVFVSTRAKRWVGCWMTQVGTLFRCDRQGGNIRPLSFNCEHDNTPAVLADGRILYTRWEYVDRSQVGYHQLWTMNPDGTAVTAYLRQPAALSAVHRRQTDPRPERFVADRFARTRAVGSSGTRLHASPPITARTDERGCRRITPTSRV